MNYERRITGQSINNQNLCILFWMTYSKLQIKLLDSVVLFTRIFICVIDLIKTENTGYKLPSILLLLTKIYKLTLYASQPYASRSVTSNSFPQSSDCSPNSEYDEVVTKRWFKCFPANFTEDICLHGKRIRYISVPVLNPRQSKSCSILMNFAYEEISIYRGSTLMTQELPNEATYR